jgi:integrase
MVMPKLNTQQLGGKPRKPSRDFPLFVHATGRWAKKVRGRFVYFGKTADDPKGAAALNLWLDQRDDLLAGRTPRVKADGLTVRDVCNRFLTTKSHLVDTNEITARHFADLHTAAELVVDQFGRHRLVCDLASDDFEALRAALAKTRRAWALGGVIQKIRSMFKYAYEAGLIDKPVRYGPGFKRPGKAAIRRERNGKLPRMFEAKDLRKIIDAAGQPMRAMILLGLNAGLGNSDVGQLRFRNVDLSTKWLDFPRPKTGVARRAPLWKETIAALNAAIAARPAPKDEVGAELVFITKYGQPWAKDRMANPVSHEFRKLLIGLKLYRKGLSFYTLRHVFETIGGEARDQVAVDRIMGHARECDAMASQYREGISDERLVSVSEHVRCWLFAKQRTDRKRRAK